MVTYAIVNKNDRIYVGISTDAQCRLREHNAGYVFSTKGYRPWRLFYIEKHGTRSEARAREKYLKSGVGKEFLKKLVGRDSSVGRAHPW
ncbi:MAG TPA: GIY-YIG nuclease family protein [Candidatus Paceibacterota bacterium]